jgi:hypothetical protein
MMRTFYMLRNTLWSVLIVLAVATVSQATATPGAPGDGKTSLAYDRPTGAWTIHADGQPVGLFQIQSASGIFTNSAAATLPAGALFETKAANEIGWAALPVSAIPGTGTHNLGVISATNLEQAFLLNDLTLLSSGGFGTDNRSLDLIVTGGGTTNPPNISLVDVGEYEGLGPITQQLTASGTGNMWSALMATTGSPSMGATLTPEGLFSWNPAGSARGPKGNGVAYAWTATVTNADGADTDVAIRLSLIPEPATMSLVGLAMVALAGLFRRR